MTPESLLAQFDVMAEAPNGVEKLRELVLQLAVRGKLVPQDPADEPASVLLERIVAAASTSRSAVLDEAQGGLFEIPSSWVWIRVDQLGRFLGGGTPSKADPGFWSGDIPWVSPKDMKRPYIDDSIDHVSERAIENSAIRRIPPEAILLVVRGMILAHTFPVAISRRDVTINQDMKAIALWLPEIREYVLRALKASQSRVLSRVERSSHGTCRLEARALNTFRFPLPPLDEQHRIVAKVDELMALCDQLEARQRQRAELRAQLNRSALHALTSAAGDAEVAERWQRLSEHFDLSLDAPETIAELREAISQLAVRGRLVSIGDGEGSADDLLRQLDEERRLSRDRKVTTSTVLPPLEGKDVPFELPTHWSWSRLGLVTAGIEAGWSPECEPQPRENDQWGVLKMSAVSWGTFDPQENKALPRSLSPRPELEVKRGDFLMTRANTSELVGRSVVVAETPPRLLLNDKTLRVIVPASMSRRYLNLFNNSRPARAYYAALASGTSSSMRNLSREQIRMLPVPLPPLAEQRRIVACVDELMALCDALEARLTSVREHATHLVAEIVHRLTAA